MHYFFFSERKAHPPRHSQTEQWFNTFTATTIMAEVDVRKPCSNPGCDQPGTSSCSACKTTVYCCVVCQTADWPRHKEECPGHLRKMGMAHLKKAKVFYDERNWVQALRYADLAATKLKQLKRSSS